MRMRWDCHSPNVGRDSCLPHFTLPKKSHRETRNGETRHAEIRAIYNSGPYERSRGWSIWWGGRTVVVQSLVVQSLVASSGCSEILRSRGERREYS